MWLYLPQIDCLCYYCETKEGRKNMKIISPANETVMTILGKAKEGTSYRMLHHTAETLVDEGMLIFNLLTKELLLLTREEYENRLELDYLKQRWFVVPTELKEKEYAAKVRWVEQLRKKKTTDITDYTIFTTTDCNARCYYCFELGWNRVHMTEDIAKHALDYIKKHCGGKKVSLTWFGGEPLYNMEPISIICQGLQQAGIAYTSSMATNGYLLDEQTVKKCAESWNLTRLQIALDGTEAVYNKIKAYIYKDVNAYETVMHNIGLVLAAGIEVYIRLNMDLSNHSDLMALVDELARRFGSSKKLYIYANHLYKNGVPSADLYTPQEWIQREEAMTLLEQKITHYGLHRKGGIRKHIKTNHCMADLDSSIVIYSDGHLGRCEHCNENEYVGHVTGDEIDAAKTATWKEQIPEIPECDTCFFYPSCLELKKCSTSSVCFPQARETNLRRVREQMRNEYDKQK